MASNNNSNNIILQEEYGIEYNPDYFGTFCKKRIPRDTLLLVEEPYLCGEEIDGVIALHESGQLESQTDDDDYLVQTIKLQNYQREEIWSLHDQFTSTNNDEKRLLGVIKSNAYWSTDCHGLALYPLISRLNHSCKPNIGYGFDGWKMRLFTTRDIEPGEELTSCYSDVVLIHPRTTRMGYLKAKFNFDCQCDGCSSEQHCPESDVKRDRLRFLAGMLGNDISRDETAIKDGHLKILLESIKLMQEESLDTTLTSTYALATRWAIKLGKDQSVVEELSRKCMIMLELSKGPNHTDTEEFRELITSYEICS